MYALYTGNIVTDPSYSGNEIKVIHIHHHGDDLYDLCYSNDLGDFNTPYHVRNMIFSVLIINMANSMTWIQDNDLDLDLHCHGDDLHHLENLLL